MSPRLFIVFFGAAIVLAVGGLASWQLRTHRTPPLSPVAQPTQESTQISSPTPVPTQSEGDRNSAADESARDAALEAAEKAAEQLPLKTLFKKVEGLEKVIGLTDITQLKSRLATFPAFSGTPSPQLNCTPGNESHFDASTAGIGYDETCSYCASSGFPDVLFRFSRLGSPGQACRVVFAGYLKIDESLDGLFEKLDLAENGLGSGSDLDILFSDGCGFVSARGKAWSAVSRPQTLVGYRVPGRVDYDSYPESLFGYFDRAFVETRSEYQKFNQQLWELGKKAKAQTIEDLDKNNPSLARARKVVSEIEAAVPERPSALTAQEDALNNSEAHYLIVLKKWYNAAEHQKDPEMKACFFSAVDEYLANHLSQFGSIPEEHLKPMHLQLSNSVIYTYEHTIADRVVHEFQKTRCGHRERILNQSQKLNLSDLLKSKDLSDSEKKLVRIFNMEQNPPEAKFLESLKANDPFRDWATLYVARLKVGHTPPSKNPGPCQNE